MKQIKGYLVTVLAAMCWGFSGTMGEYLLNEKKLDVNWLTSVRMLGAGIILILYVILKEGVTDKHKHMLTHRLPIFQLISFGLLGLAFNQLSYLKTISYSNAGTATVLQYSGTVLLVVYVCIKLARLPYKTEIVAIALALIGTFLLATHGQLHQLVLNESALFFGLLSALGLATLTLLPIPLSEKYGSSLTVGYGMLCGGIFMLLMFSVWDIPVILDAETIIALIAIIVVGTILSYNLFLYGIHEIGSIKASLIACLEPVAAIIFSMVLLGTEFYIMDYIGSAVIVTAAVLVSVVDLMESKKNNGSHIAE